MSAPFMVRHLCTTAELALFDTNARMMPGVCELELGDPAHSLASGTG